MPIKRIILPVAVVLLWTVLGCNKEDKDDPKPISRGQIEFNIFHYVDGKPLAFDTMEYQNAAGNEYSVSKLHYYISGITLLGDLNSGYKESASHYIDARDQGTLQFKLDNIPVGNYSGISLLIGLDSNTNKTGALQPTLENINMAWPDVMGGGYHFMKFEGYFKELNASSGYALHIGTNECLVQVDVIHSFNVTGGLQEIQLNMNLNEWFVNPETYDLNEGNYTMGIREKMLIIAENGKDVFTME